MNAHLTIELGHLFEAINFGLPELAIDEMYTNEFGHLFNALWHGVPEPTTDFPQFMQVPAEIRAKIINQYLITERNLDWYVDHNGLEPFSGGMKKAIHHDDFGSPCCVWNWPESLTICDKASEQDLPHILLPKWFPNLALTSHTMRGEVAVQMLKSTKTFTLKFDVSQPVKISRWFMRFLAAFPGTESFDAIKDLNLPHIHWYGSTGPTTALTNPDVDLMLQCKKLERIGLTFHAKRVNCQPYDWDGFWRPLSLDEFLDRFKLRPIVGCDGLKQGYIGAIRYSNMYLTSNVDQFQVLREFGKWLHDEFGKKQPPQNIEVLLYPRTGVFNGWHDPEQI